jgi:hypothetical protein
MLATTQACFRPDSRHRTINVLSIGQSKRGGTVLRFPDRAQAGAAMPSAADSLLPVLIILHQETPTLGRVGNVLRALGHRLDIRRPGFGDPLARAAG